MEIVGDVGADVGGQACHQVPRCLRAVGHSRRCAQRIAGEEAADVNLVGSGAFQVVVTIAGIEVPLIAKVVVNAGHPEVVVLGNRQIPSESLYVRVAAAETATWTHLAAACTCSRTAGRGD